jgi:primosomal protein N' (replication factor Y)
LLRQLLDRGYPGFAAAALEERRAAGLPPFAALALLRAEAVAPEVAQEFLAAARASAEALLGADAGAGATPAGVELSGPAPAPMERRAGRHRAQLLVRADGRMRLQSLLARWVPGLSALPGARKARWAIDVDPQELL